MDENFHININTIKMNRSIQSIILVCLLIGNVFTAPQNPAVATPGGAPAGGILPIALPIHALPHSGIVGAFDNLGAGIANFGNAQGSGFDAFLSGVFNSIGTLFSGLLGSGAVNTAFLNYNNRPPVDPNAGAATAGGNTAPGPAPGPTPGPAPGPAPDPVDNPE